MYDNPEIVPESIFTITFEDCENPKDWTLPNNDNVELRKWAMSLLFRDRHPVTGEELDLIN